MPSLLFYYDYCHRCHQDVSLKGALVEISQDCSKYVQRWLAQSQARAEQVAALGKVGCLRGGFPPLSFSFCCNFGALLRADRIRSRALRMCMSRRSSMLAWSSSRGLATGESARKRPQRGGIWEESHCLEIWQRHFCLHYLFATSQGQWLLSGSSRSS